MKSPLLSDQNLPSQPTVTLAPMPSSCVGQVNTLGSHPSSSTQFIPTSTVTPMPSLVPITCHPAVFATISAPLQKFRGDSAGWAEFKRKWTERLGLLQASGPVDDRILLAQFVEAMDQATKRQIEARRAEEPTLSYAQIFAEVDNQFSRTVRHCSRAKLQNLTLRWVKGEKMSMKDYNSFDAEFRILRADCQETGEEEA